MTWLRSRRKNPTFVDQRAGEKRPAIALWFKLPASEWAKVAAAGAFALIAIATVAAVFTRLRWAALLVFGFAFGGVVIWWNEAAGRGHCSGTPALRMPSKTGSSPARYVGSVAHRRPGSADAGDGEGRIEREAGLDRGMRLVQSTKLREGGGQLEIWKRIVPVRLDRPSTPCDRLLERNAGLPEDRRIVGTAAICANRAFCLRSGLHGVQRPKTLALGSVHPCGLSNHQIHPAKVTTRSG